MSKRKKISYHRLQAVRFIHEKCIENNSALEILARTEHSSKNHTVAGKRKRVWQQKQDMKMERCMEFCCHTSAVLRGWKDEMNSSYRYTIRKQFFT